MIPPQIDNFSAYLIGVIAAFLAMYVEDRKNIYQKIFLAITFFSIRWLTVAMAARLDDLDVRSAIQFNDSIEIFSSRDCVHIVTHFQKLDFFHFSKLLRCT